MTRISNKGFTLVELIVAMSVFIILLGIVVNIFIGSLRSQRALVALRLTNDNASLALEQMAREIRTGEKFYIHPKTAGQQSPCNNNVNLVASPAGEGLGFCNAANKDVVYRMDGGVIERSTDGGRIFSPITGTNVDVKKLKFILPSLTLPGPPGSWPSRVTVTLSVGSRSVELESFVTNIQTTISGRNL